VPEEGAGDGDPLGLASGKAPAAFAERGVKSLRQPGEQRAEARGVGGFGDAVAGGVGAAERDVLGEGGGEQVRTLS
jgi:hypothetical protein